MVFNGRIYETNGAEAIGMHEPEAVRPLSPVPQPPSLRFFPNPHQIPGDDNEPVFAYGNPSAIVGASQIVNVPAHIGNLTFEPYLAAVLVSGGYDVDLEYADDMILGLTIMLALVDRSASRVEGLYGRSHDLGIGLGPVLTTPDELDDFIASQQFGRSYRLSVAARVNGVDRARGNTEELPFTFAQAIVAASRSCTLREGEVLALGPLCDVPNDVVLEAGDEVSVAVENLGTLSLKLSTEA